MEETSAASENRIGAKPGEEGGVEAGELTRASIAAAAGAWIGLLVGPTPMVSATNSVFLASLVEAFATNRTAVATALAASVWAVAIFVPLLGRVMDRFGVRAVIVPGVALFGTAFIGLSLAQNLVHYFLVQAVLALAAAAHSSVGYAKVISSWFNLRRGVVLGLCVAMGTGVGQVLMPKVSSALIENFGWRGAYQAIGMFVLLVGLPLIFALLRTPQGSQGAHAQTGELGRAIGLTRAEALRKPAFYLVWFAVMLASLSLVGTVQHSVPMFLERGLSLDEATTTLSFVFAGVIVGELTSGLLVDRFNTPRVILPYFIIAFVGLITLHSTNHPVLLPVAALLMGLGFGGEISQNAYMVSRYFGLKAFASLYGLTFGGVCVGIGLGLIIGGAIRDAAGSYDLLRYVFGATMLASVSCIASLGPFVFKPRKRRARRVPLSAQAVR